MKFKSTLLFVVIASNLFISQNYNNSVNKGESSQQLIINTILDSDGDGIPDYLDVDDDNDGILDINECYTNIGSTVMWPNTGASYAPVINNSANIVNANNASGGSGLTFLADTPGGSIDNWYTISGVDALNEAASKANNEYVQYTFTTGNWDALSIKKYFSRWAVYMGDPSSFRSKVQYTFFGEISSNAFTVDSNNFTGNINYTADILTQTFSIQNPILLIPNTTYTIRIYFYAVVGGGVSQIAHDDFNVFFDQYCDTDRDGIPDYLDLDSDADGCSDAIEGGASITEYNLVTASGTLNGGSTNVNKNLCAGSNCINTGSNNNGLPRIISITNYSNTTGQSVANSINALVNDCICYETPTNLTAIVPVNNGITSLGRAGGTNSNWPMLRNSAYTALESKTKGLVITRNSSPETTIAIPVVGMMVFDTDEDEGKGCLKIYIGSGAGEGWKCFTTQGCPPPSGN